MSTSSTQKSKQTGTLTNPQRVHYNNRVKIPAKQNASFALPLLESLLNHKSEKKFDLGLSIIEEALRDDDRVRLIQRVVRRYQAVTRRQLMDSQKENDDTLPNLHSSQRPELQQTNYDDPQKSDDIEQKLSNKRLANPSSHDNNESSPLRKKSKIIGESLGVANYCSDPIKATWSHPISHTSLKSSNRSSYGVVEHWLWRSLRAYSIAERKAVARLLILSVSCQATKSISATDSNEAKVEAVAAYFRRKHLRNRLSKKIVQLFDRYVNSNATDYVYSNLGDLDFNNKAHWNQVAVINSTGCSKARLAIEWVSLLDVLWMPPSEFIGISHSLGSNLDASAATGSAITSTIADASVHWRWLTRSIWSCARNVRRQFSNTRVASDVSDHAVALASLSYLALTLAVRREYQVTNHHSRNVATPGSNNKNKEATSNILGATNNNKKSTTSSRQRSNSNSSLRSNDTSITALGVPKGVNASNLLGSKSTKHHLSNIVEDAQMLSKSLQAFNSTYLWTIDETEQGVDDLSPLACLIGAYWITRDIVYHSSVSNASSKSSNTLSLTQTIESGNYAREYCGGGSSLLASGGGGSASFVALQRAVHTLEQLVFISKECEVVIVDGKDDKKEKSKSNKNCSKRKTSSEKRARTSSISSNSKSRSRSDSKEVSNEEDNDPEEGDDDDEEMDEDEDDIELEAAELEEEEEDDDEVPTEKNSTEVAFDSDTTNNVEGNINNGTNCNAENDDQGNTGDKTNLPVETSGDECPAEAEVDEAEEDEDEDEEGDEDHEEEEGSRIPDEEDEDIESIDHDEEEDDDEEEEGAEGGEDGAAEEEEDTDEHADDVCRLHPLGTESHFSSHEVEVDEGEEEDDDDDEADIDDDDDGDDVDGMDLDELTAAVENANADISLRNSSSEKQKNDLNSTSSAKLSPPLGERKLSYVKACMQVLAFQHPPNQQNQHNFGFHRTSFLSFSAEDAMLGMINDIVKPPKKPLNGKIIMRRAPTQEEFFRGSLSRNPISMSSLKVSGRGNSVGGRRSIDNGVTFSNGDEEPTVGDLRQHIANDLQMADSAELIEIIVANKILDVGLKLRVVHQVLWRNHLIDNAAAASGTSTSSQFGSGSTGASYFASAGSAISMIFTSNSGSSDRNGGTRITSDTPYSALPPMVATYRLAGVDGEATEDTVHPGDLVDPDEPSGSASPAEIEQLLENEFGITRLAANDRGVYILLRSVQNIVYDFLRRIRRDDVLFEGNQNPSRLKFKKSPPCQALILLRHCARLAANRKKLLQARAPTALLTLLLDVLKTVEESTSTSDSTLKSSPTSEILQELIEVLTSDISTSSDVEQDNNSDYASLAYDQDITSMPMLLESIETISLSAPLRNVIAKLLPFLTYGQTDLSRELAQRFNTHIVVENLARYEDDDSSSSTDRGTILMNTFIQTALSLQSNNVCNTLRGELLNCGFHERLIGFIMQNIPSLPPPWSAALHGKGESIDSQKINTQIIAGAWREFYLRGGLKTAFKMITVICIKHSAAQTRIAKMSDFLRSCHWLETTSDNGTYNVETKGLGLLAETFLDEISEGNDFVRKQVDFLRKKTRLRKKELAESRRALALSKLTNFGRSSGATIEPSQIQSTPRIGLASILTPVVELFRDSKSTDKLNKEKTMLEKDKTEKPAWLAEAEMMEDEQGLTCAVCQEGRTLQPSEVLGLYAFVKKVAIPLEQCGSRASIDGTNLLRALPSSMPDSLIDSHVANEWFPIAKATAEEAARSPTSSLTVSATGGRRNSIFTTTVSAGNGIHITCHRKARQADRSHPKAPKSEWEGASLRNNRCNCNVILPLVSSRSAKVPLMAVDAALTDHQSAVSNLLGSNPKSMRWTVLHDLRFLLLRMAYGEALNADCGGGSLASNCKLLFYQMLMADMFDHDAQVDQPQLSHHARGLSAALLTGCAVLMAKDSKDDDSFTSLTRGIADAATMACVTCILFHNSKPDENLVHPPCKEVTTPHPKRQWVVGKEYFLRSLIVCAGRRHALGIDGSGCQNKNRVLAKRASSFADWDILAESDRNAVEGEDSAGISDEGIDKNAGNGEAESKSTTDGSKNPLLSSGKPSIQDFQNVLRPMITFYAIMNQLSAEFSVEADDVQIAESAQRLEKVIISCQRSKNINELLQKAELACMEHDDIIDLLQKGMVVAG